MGRRPDGRTPRNIRVGVRLTDQGRAALDEMRGTTTASAFIRSLLEAEYRRRKS